MESSLLEIISNNKAVDRFIRNEGRLVVQDNLALAYLACAAYLKENVNISLIAPNLYIAQNIYEYVSSIVGEDNCLLFPMDEIYHQTNYAYSKEMLAQRLYVMNKCFDGKKRILITHQVAAERYLPNPELYKDNTISLEVGKSYDLQKLVKKLSEMSFTRLNKIDQSLQFALRGDILDVFPINSEHPYRIEFFDDEIESIREFHIEDQISFASIDKIEIFPSSDLLIEKESLDKGVSLIKKKLDQDTKSLSNDYQQTLIDKISMDIEQIRQGALDENMYRYYHFFFPTDFYSIFDYFKSDINVVYQYEENAELAKHYVEEIFNYVQETHEHGLSLLDIDVCIPFQRVNSKCKNTIPAFTYFEGDEDYYLDIKSIPFFSRNLINSVSLINGYLEGGYKVIVALGRQQFNAYQDFLRDREISFEVVEYNSLPESNLGITEEDLKSGFELVDEKIVFLSKKEIFGFRQDLTLFASRYKKAVVLNSYDELKEGDYVVHEENGIGKYLGLVTLDNNGVVADYLKILYADNTNLYVPLARFSKIRKYVTSEGKAPRLSKLGGKDWSKAKQKIKDEVDFLSDRLIELYAKRESTPGFACKEDDDFQKEFESAFPYPLTVDQENAIRDIKHDMEKPHPMDRLLCGDVGFGKTEVAFRAAFKAILSGKQVALLCPTTILAKQHFDVASSRFGLFDVKIALLSRFVPESKQKEYIEEIKDQKIHLIIGTHRLLSKEVEIPNLGLLIVDEEQRFGVEHKERIKEISSQVDVLTLTATPIPRTLQMSLLGIRNMSQLQIAPHARMPIQTYVLGYSLRLAKEAISRELSRGGQVYYLHNKISTITRKAEELSKLLPNARINVVHARMDKDDIDEIMSQFYMGEIDVLICTSIVEAGLDVPNANTIIIEDADDFGLSQLYQIKGRVGRSNRVAYAYLFFNDDKELNENAKKRLQAIKEFTELGSGIRIAEKDLNIRGAGDILGSAQSGFIDSVGIDMYINILSDVINQKKGVEAPKAKIKPTNISINGYIPTEYALDADKIQIYQEIEACSTISSIEILRRKLRDIYGRLPKEVEKILLKRKIDILSSSFLIESVVEGDGIIITLTPEASKINGIAMKIGNRIKDIATVITFKIKDKKVIFTIRKGKDSMDALLKLLEAINASNGYLGEINLDKKN